MSYKVNGFDGTQTYFVSDEAELLALQANKFLRGTFLLGTKEDAEAFLAEKQAEILSKEAARFSVCATFVNGFDHVWREVRDDDPEDTVCQVFDTIVGQYTQAASKPEAYKLNEEKKKQFLDSIGMGAVIEIPVDKEPLSSAVAKEANQIPVEKM